MAKIMLTERQQAVVENRGGELLVSAAAGSGKTRVLVDRLFHRVTEDGCQLDDFLIITYTRAAAAELRGRIAQELGQRLAENPGDRHLQRQFVRLYRADIKTVDSFCAALLREYIHLLDTGTERSLTADFRVLDESEAQLLCRRVLARVLEEFYAAMEEGSGAAQLADTFGFGRDDRRLEELVLDLYRRLQSHPYPQEWLEEQRESWLEIPDDVGETVWGQRLMDNFRRKAAHWRDLLEGALEEMETCPSVLKGYGEPFAQVVDGLDRLSREGRWDALGRWELAFPRLKPVKDADGGGVKNYCKMLWDLCKKEMGEAKGAFEVSGAECAGDLRATAPAMLALLDLTAHFSRAYQEEKARRNVADFSDQEHFAIQLLTCRDGTPTEVGEVVSARYVEIMVDEYQDTNGVQNYLFEAIGKGKLFTVGDVKQSIYRFRLADPTIFLRKYRAFVGDDEAVEGEPRKILLSQNFRSRQEVLDAANDVFSALMSEEMGELEYGEQERLNFGAAYYPSREDCQTEFHLLDFGPREEGMAGRALAEARYVAGRIARLLREGFPVSEGGQLRPCRPEDIVVLMRSPGPRLRHYARALREEGIPCASEENEDFFSSMEIAVTFSLLQLLDNPRQDVPLISVLRSPLFGFTPDRLAAIRGACPQGDFYDALRADGGRDVTDFLDRLGRLRQEAGDLGVHQLLWRIYDDLDVMAIFGAMDGGRERRENLIALFDHARAFEAAGYRGLFAFVTHLRRLLEEGEQPDTASASAASGVRIMSIHKSKGLEFPIVILADLAKEFNRMDLQTPVLVHPELGLGPVRIDLEHRVKYPTVAKDALAAQLEREMKSEELRVLYVAMTRPQEKLIMVASFRGAARRLQKLAALAASPVPPETVAAAGSMAEWLLLAAVGRPEAGCRAAYAGAEASPAFSQGRPWEITVEDGTPWAMGRQAAEEAARQAQEPPFATELLTYVYPFEAATRLPTKLTATQLKGRPLDREAAEGAPQPLKTAPWPRPLAFGTEGDRQRALERGVSTHLALQYLDFAAEDVAGAVEDLVNRGLLTAEQAEEVDLRSLERFLASPLAEELRRAAHVEREYRFSLLVSAGEWLGEDRGDDQVLLQGVVDCFFDTPEGLVVVDFKTDRVSAAAVEERAEHYRPQLTAYSQALSRIFRRPVSRRLLCFLGPGQVVSV